MGCEGWSYTVPYQGDIEAALQALRQRVFQEGDFDNWKQEAIERIRNMTPEEYQRYGGPYQRSEQQERGARSDSAALEPQVALIARLEQEMTTIEGVLEGDDGLGTHSILDIQHIYPTPQSYTDDGPPLPNIFGVIVPVPFEEYEQVFETRYPTLEVIEEMAYELDPYHHSGNGVYVLAYRDTTPEFIYFAGCTGD